MKRLIMTIVQKYRSIVNKLNSLKDLPLLFARIVLAYGLYIPAMNKINNLSAITDWFGELGIPAPQLSAYLSAGTEASGIVLLSLGLGTRLISIPLIINMVVAIITVHWPNGFDAGNNGFEIPVYYMVMLFTLLIFGPGKSSVDYLLSSILEQK